MDELKKGDYVSGSMVLTDAEILDEACKRYPENISVIGKDSDKKQRRNQRFFIEGARWAAKKLIDGQQAHIPITDRQKNKAK